LGNFTFWISLSLSPKFKLSTKLSQKVKLIYSELRTEQKTELIAESKVRTKFKVNVNYMDLALINLHA